MAPVVSLVVDLSTLLLLLYVLTRFGARWVPAALDREPALALASACGIGLGFSSLVAFALAVGGILRPTELVASGVFVMLLGSSRAHRWAGQIIDDRQNALPWTRFELLLALLLGIVFLTHLLYAYAPPVAEDEVIYQLALPDLFARAGHFVETRDNFCSFYPLNANLLYAAILVFRTALTIKAFIWLNGLLVSALLWIFIRRFADGKRLTALIAVLMFNAMPYATSLQGITSSDFFDLFFELLAVSTIWAWMEQEAMSLIVLAGFFSGIGLGTRPYAAGWIAGLGLLLSLKGRFKETFVFGFVAIVAFAGWPAHNAWLTGNPFYPKALWPGAAQDPYLNAFEGTAHATLLGDLWRYPLFLSSGGLIWGMGVLPFSLAPIAWAAFWKRPFTRDLMLIMIVTTAFTFLLPVRQVRYFGQTFPFFALFAAQGLVILQERLSRFSWRAVQAWVLASIVFPGLLLSTYFGAKRIPFMIGRQSSEAYLAKNYTCFEGYDMMRYIQTHVPVGSQILTPGLIFSPRYYYPTMSLLGMARYAPEVYGSSSEWLERLRQDHIGYLLYFHEHLKPQNDGSYLYTYLPSLHLVVAALPPTTLHLLYETPKATLYAVTP